MTSDHEEQHDERTTAGILAGGASTRMGHSKALLVLPGGATLIEQAVRVAQNVARETVILGSPEPLPPALAGLKNLPDAQPDRGPLAGLCTLLEYAGGGWSLLLACDMPNLRGELLERLLAETNTATDAVVFERSARRDSYHPCCALYHARVLPAVKSELLRGAGRMHTLLGLIRKTVLRPTPAEATMLANVNTPQAWDAARRAGD